MKEAGVDISGNQTKSVQNFLDKGTAFDYVITVCDEASGEQCPIFPDAGFREHWSFADPSAIEGSFEEKLEGTRHIRDQIEERVLEFIKKIEALKK